MHFFCFVAFLLTDMVLLLLAAAQGNESPLATEGSGVIAGFYLGACSQGKACCHNSETKSHAGGNGFLCFF